MPTATQLRDPHAAARAEADRLRAAAWEAIHAYSAFAHDPHHHRFGKPRVPGFPAWKSKEPALAWKCKKLGITEEMIEACSGVRAAKQRIEKAIDTAHAVEMGIDFFADVLSGLQDPRAFYPEGALDAARDTFIEGTMRGLYAKLHQERTGAAEVLAARASVKGEAA